MAKNYTSLCIFDLDMTLFSVPGPNEGDHNTVSWWDERESLMHPLITPIEGVAIAFSDASDDDDTFTAIVTGRQEHLRADVKELLSRHLMAPDALMMKPSSLYGPESTPAWKAATVSWLLNKLPLVTRVTVWDDKDENLEEIADALPEYVEGIFMSPGADDITSAPFRGI